MLVFTTENDRWRALRVDTKAALPLEDLVVVAGVGASRSRQLTCLGGRVKPAGTTRLLLVLPLPSLSTTSTTATPAIQVLEVGECAVQLLRDVKACFPSLVRKNPLADAGSDDDSDSEEDDDTITQRQQKKKNAARAKAEEDAQTHAASMATVAPFLAATRVRVLPSLAALHEAYAFDGDALVAAIERDVTSQFTDPRQLQFLCLEFPADAPGCQSGELNFGVVFVHERDAQAAKYLQIPLPREPRGYFAVDQQYGDSNDQEDGDEWVVFQDANVFTFGSKREASEHGGGKTSAETVKNIRLRHASGTFCTLVYPTMEWRDVVQKYGVALPQLRELQGELRSRRFMGVVPNRPVEILLETHQS